MLFHIESIEYWNEMINMAVQQCQDPAAVGQITKIQTELQLNKYWYIGCIGHEYVMYVISFWIWWIWNIVYIEYIEYIEYIYQPFADLDTAVQQYQDPAAADKITKIQKELEETKQVCLYVCIVYWICWIFRTLSYWWDYYLKGIGGDEDAVFMCAYCVSKILHVLYMHILFIAFNIHIYMYMYIYIGKYIFIDV